jgi:hypothetical protein
MLQCHDATKATTQNSLWLGNIRSSTVSRMLGEHKHCSLSCKLGHGLSLQELLEAVTKGQCYS